MRGRLELRISSLFNKLKEREWSPGHVGFTAILAILSAPPPPRRQPLPTPWLAPTRTRYAHPWPRWTPENRPFM